MSQCRECFSMTINKLALSPLFSLVILMDRLSADEGQTLNLMQSVSADSRANIKADSRRRTRYP